jgi:hypothetical protein
MRTFGKADRRVKVAHHQHADSVASIKSQVKVKVEVLAKEEEEEEKEEERRVLAVGVAF